MADLIKIAITAPAPGADESARVAAMLSLGWSRVHLRYPSLSLAEVRRIVEEIPQRWHRQLRLHGHFELLNEFNIGGLHLNSRCPEPPAGYNGALSKSCHSLAEVVDAAGQGRFDYVSLSPIFESISKPGYRPVLNRDEMIAAAAAMPVIALGGVTPERVAELAGIGFAGYAVLGTVQQARTYDELKNIYTLYNNATIHN